MADRHLGHPNGQRIHMRSAHSRPLRRSAHTDPPDSAPGICRICRGDGTPEEPLFYPCKCSGSIQHVHQDCLMEWLSHSQKKYCELCKTSFRFTKFYNPNMPQSLPVSVFFRQVSRYIIENSLGWFRVLVAVSFWVIALPWFMRRGWSSMFWLSQESWSASPIQGHADVSSGSNIFLSSTMLGLDTCPSSPFFAPTTTPAADVETMLGWWGSQSISGFLLRCFCKMTGMAVPSSVSTLHVLHPSVPRPIESLPPRAKAQTPTLLSNVRFLQKITRNRYINQAIISVFEGQVVTVVAIVSFILVILVRDYVVQQQPEMNMRGGVEANEEQDQPPVVVAPVRPQPVEDTDDSENEALPYDEQEERPGRSQAERRDGTRRRREPPAELFASDNHGEGSSRGSGTRTGAETGDGRAPAEQEPSRGEPSLNTGSRSDWVERSSSSRRSSDGGSTDVVFTPDHAQSDSTDPIPPTREVKGKEKMTLPGPEPHPQPSSSAQPREPEPGPSRPRAISDGPQVHTNISPLANNTWSFSRSSSDDANDRDTIATSDHAAHSFLQPEPSAQKDNERDRVTQSQTVPWANSVRDYTDTDEDVQGPPPENIIGRVPSLSQAPAASPPIPVSPTTYWTDKVTDFMWGDIGEAGQGAADADESSVDGADDGQWIDIPMDDGEDIGAHGPGDDIDIGGVGVDAGDAGDVGGPAGAGMDPEAIEDLEDFEGIMELLGMRGPITNLFSNVIFCAVLVQTALVACVFIPFNVGRVTVWVLAKPARLIRILFELSKVSQDLCFVVAGFLSWVAFNLVDMVTSLIGGPVAAQVLSARKGSWGFFMRAGSRVTEFLALDFSPSESGVQFWSAASHEALMGIKQQIVTSLISAGNGFSAVFQSNNPFIAMVDALKTVCDSISGVYSMLWDPAGWDFELSSVQGSTVNLDNAEWSAADITWAVLAGYVTVLALAVLYLKSGIRFARGTALEDWEAGIIDSLHQASGILKVITIISIEMLVFPLYCGLLLDCALLPLFVGASMKSRFLFTYNNPWTSVFVHWFVGTGYMFHFALFVSMCRKIMRPGVLYFIRDPDDPEFHPVRDVLERNLTTQLRKILFSAFVYGALVIVCLGGVVWGLASVAPSVLPIHYSSNEPVLEFPVDLLFYNFFMPLAFRVLKPGDGLHAMYRWCFRKSARVLRLTYFLFGERRIDEEGALQLAHDSREQSLPPYRRLFLGLDQEKNRVIPKSWKDIIDGVDTRQSKSLPHEIRHLRHKKARLVDSGQLIQDGRFVRAPASDRVKLPKGSRVFLDVNERGRRTDGQPDEGLYATDQFQMVYVPPRLLCRIFLFILFIWTFAAVTGVGLTIIPLVLGRMMFKAAIPTHVRTNDIYAFCIGIHVLGVVAYSVFHAARLWASIRSWSSKTTNGGKAGHEGWRRVRRSCARAAKILYAYTFILVICPLTMSALVELYVNLPAHTYMSPPSAGSMSGGSGAGESSSQHGIRVIEAWTLGLLYMRLAVKLSHSFLYNTRFALAMRAILRRGWLDPDIRILTKAFIVPGLLVSAVAIFAPAGLVRWLESRDVFSWNDQVPFAAAQRVIRYRQSYPMVAFATILAKYCIVMKGSFDALKAQVRDDAYLMGERLQNYDGSPPDTRTGKAQRGETGMAED